MIKSLQDMCRLLGFAAISLDWERPFLGPLYAWSSAIQGKPGLMKIPTMLKGDRLQRPLRPPRGEPPVSFFTDAKAEDGKAWIGGFLEICRGVQVFGSKLRNRGLHGPLLSPLPTR